MTAEPVLDAFAKRVRAVAAEILGDPAAIELITKQRIDQLIANGELVPRERLLPGVGVELVPSGVTRAARDLIAATRDDEADVAGAASALEFLLAADHADEEPEPPAGKTRAKKATKRTAKAPAEPATPADEKASRSCKKCGSDVTDEQALLSYSAVRGVYCETDLATAERPRRAS